MVKLKNIVRFLNKELQVSKIKDFSKNGLQVRGTDEIKRIVFGVDACMELFEKAKQKNCDLIIVHHGLLWKNDKMDYLLKNRINFLKKNKINLYAAHLPLDAHQKYGNNIQLAELIGIKNPKKFCIYKGTKIGYYGELNLDLKDLIKLVNIKLKTKCLVHNFGRKKVNKIGVVSGRAADEIRQCLGIGVDTYITGEPVHEEYHTAKETKINVLYAGHYATETFGVKALMGLIREKFKIETVFIDIPTGM